MWIRLSGMWEAGGLLGEPQHGLVVTLDKGPEGVSQETWPARQRQAWLKPGHWSRHPLSWGGTFSGLQVGWEKLDWRDLGT